RRDGKLQSDSRQPDGCERRRREKDYTTKERGRTGSWYIYEAFSLWIASTLWKRFCHLPNHFGFPTPPYHDKFRQLVDIWNSSWCELFSGMLRGLSDFESRTNGLWLKALLSFDHLIRKTVPSLLLPLQSDGQF
ncbi:hypothetical protein GCG54_00015381, partial [Colletotrichum gloeosporioides]